MKFRAIMLIDLELPDFLKVAEKQLELTEMLNKMKSEDEAIVDIAIDVKERRGNSMPDLRAMKLRGA